MIDNSDSKGYKTKPLLPEDVIEYVEDFIRKLRNHDYTISSDARGILCDDYIGGSTFSKVSLSDKLAELIERYDDTSDDERDADAWRCKVWITKAFTHGVVIENRERLQARAQERDEKMASLLAENTELRKERDAAYDENAKLLYDIAELKGRIKELNEKFDRMVPGGNNNYGE